MTDAERAMLSADDAELLNRAWAGDTAAFQILCQRHEQAARRLARDLVVTVDEVDEVVAETFDQLLELTRRGSGPADAFRPYLLTAVRRVCDHRQAQSQPMTGDNPPDPGEPYLDLAVASLDDPLIVRAFLSLPERWMAVLWHIEIEGESPAEAGPLLGLTRNGVAALRRRARGGLTKAYLQMYSAGVAAGECTTVALRLGAFIRDAVSGPDSAAVTEHLSQCDNCRAVFAELSDVSLPLRAMVAPVFLGGSAAYYLAGTAATRTDAAPVAGAHAAAGIAGWLRPAAPVRDTARPLRWLAAGGAAVIALGAIAFGVSLAGHGTPLKPGSTEQAQVPASPVAVATTSQPSSTPARPSSTPARSTTAPAVVPASASRNAPVAPSASPPASTSPARPPGSSPPPSPSPSPSSAVRLTASVDVHGGHHHTKVFFQVSDTGSAGTGALTVSVTLPAGSSLDTGWQGDDGGGDGQFGDHPGWSCTPTSSGALCSHDPIPAGGTTQGMISITIDSSSACGQPVSLTADSGSASASAQSPEDIRC